MNITLKDVVDRLRMGADYTGHEITDSECEEMADAIDAHLARRSEGVSEEDVEIAGAHYFDYQWEILPAKSKEVYRAALRRALQSYVARHNRPAQEKAEPVAQVRISESGRIGISPIPGMSRKLSHMQELYTAPPAERVRVPADLHSVIPPEDRSPTAQQETYTAGYSNGCVVGWNSCRRATAGNIEMLKAKLSAAPEADHD